MPRTPRSIDRLSTRFLTLTLVYSLLVSLCAPLTLRRAEAAPRTGSATVVTTQTTHNDGRRAGELLVRFRAGSSEQERTSAVERRGGRRGRQLRGGDGVEKIDLINGQEPEALAAQLSTDPAVEFVEPNFLITTDQTTPNDPRFTEQWALKNAGQAGGQQGADINADAAWQTTTGTAATVIAVIDSGIDFTHPDLTNNQWANARERANRRDDDHDGMVDDLHGWDWIANSNQVSDQNGHGTAVAGIIAAEGNNGTGVTGVMWRASLMSLCVLDSTGTGDVATAVEAIDYAVTHGAQVINLSWGTDAESLTLRDAIARAGQQGVLVVCSAGNSGRNIDGVPYYPAAYDLPNLIAVAATDSTDNLTSWSNWGATHVTVAAPGVNILTTKLGGDYWTINGTSAAAPLVSGVAGLVKTLNLRLDAADTRTVIVNGTRHTAALEGKVSSGGVVSAAGALNALNTIGAGGGGGNNGGGSNGNGGGGNNGQGQGHQPVPHPTPGRGSGGHGPNGGFDGTPAPSTKDAPPGFGNQDAERRRGSTAPSAPTFIHADTMPLCDDNCGGDYVRGGAGGTDPYFGTARVRRENQTGQQGVSLGSRNFNWSAPLVSLPGRAGLDLNIALYYNSLVWTKQGTTIQYNPDHGFPGPGFSLGFPKLQPRSYNSDTGLNAYVLDTPAGGRIELRQVGRSNTYETADGSYTQLVEEDDYNIIARHSGKCLDVYNGSLDNTANVQQWECLNYANQRWQLVATDSGYYKIVARHSGKVLDVYGGSGADGANVQQYGYGGGWNQQWQLVLVDGNYYRLVARHSGKVLDVWGGSVDSGANVQQWTSHGGANQQWLLAQRRTVRTSDGTQYTFVQGADGEFRCVEIKDRNGNYITVTYNSMGRPSTVIDTLGRRISFGYDGQNYLTRIWQTWNGVEHNWVTFGYGTVTLQPNFSGLSVIATTTTPVPVLTSVGFADGSYYEFGYEGGWGMVNRINHRAPNRLLSYTTYNIPATSTAQTDCPRFTERRDWGQYANGDTDANPTASEEAVTTYAVALDSSWAKVIYPDGTMHKELYSTATDWQKGLPVGSEDWTADEGVGTKKKWTSTAWTQDITAPTSISISDAGFEIPYVGYGQYQDAPAGGSWAFTGAAGISGNASALTNGNQPAPEGAQVAYIYGGSGSTMSQSIAGFQGGVPYTLTLRTAQRYYANQGQQDFDVYLDDTLLVTFYPAFSPTGSYSDQTTTFTTSSGTHTLKFVGRGTFGQANTALIDNVRITASSNTPLNPRVTETNIYDVEGNRRRTAISYTTYSLPLDVTEYAADATTPLRRTHTDYNLDPVYLSRRIVGLPSQRMIYEGNGTLAAKTVYLYDQNWDGAYMKATPHAPVQHDETNYGVGFLAGRGNLVYVGRMKVDAPDWTDVTPVTTGYNQTGGVIFTSDALSHQTIYSYADNWTDGQEHNTFAYSTTITNPDGYQSTRRYDYDTGAVRRVQDPKGAIQKMSYDEALRPHQVDTYVDSTAEASNTSYNHMRWEYDLNEGHTRSYTTIVVGQPEAYQNTIVDGFGQVRVVVADHVGSAGGYRAAWTQHDKMGRVSQQSNMIEITGGGVPAGDDAAAGYQWTQQAYDWKGRPTLTTNVDGSTTELTYGGCGCAGGEQVTSRDERGRRKKYTKDALGRLKQVDELNWDQSVYATTTYEYDALDHLKTSNQAGQVRQLQYDGHGRLWKETTPEQGLTEYSYNVDDTVSWVKDARGAKMVFGYNGRHLVTSLSYDLSGVIAGQNVATTPGVTYTYDAVGNRTTMTDGLGSVSYTFDQLSRLTAEARTFTGLTGPQSGTYRLSYSYNLAGELTQVTNPWDVQVGYNYDRQGRLAQVTGANYAGVGVYAQNLAYRAFGGLKGLSYGNGRTLTLGYDSRLGLTSWNVPNVLGWEYSYNDYYNANTGQVLFARNTASSTVGGGRDDTLDRSYDYDHLGRLIVSHTGYEARLHMGRQQAGDPTTTSTYSQVYNYDQWGNLTSRAGWGGWNASANYPPFVNNRNPWIAYDAAGNAVNDGGQYTYDAAGRQTYATYPPSWNGYTLAQGYDGDGQRVQKVDNGTTTYYLRSSVLGGQVVCELNGAGQWARGYVYVGGQLLAMQAGGVFWVHQDPVTKSQRVTDASGVVTSTIDLDPWGGETSKSASQWFQPHRFTTYERDGNGNDQASARNYHGWLSRFDQPDPYDGSYDLADPQSFNRYSYTQNDPVNHIDPSGLLESWNVCGAQFSSCAGGGGGGYVGTPFDSGSYFMGGYNDLPGRTGRGLRQHDERMGNVRGGNGYRTDAEIAARSRLCLGGYCWDAGNLYYDSPEPPNASNPTGYIDGNLGFGFPVGPIGVGPIAGTMYELDSRDLYNYMGGVVSFPPGTTGALTYSPHSPTPGLNFSVTGSWGIRTFSLGISPPYSLNGIYAEGGIGFPGFSVSAFYVSDPNRRRAPNSATNSNGNPNLVPSGNVNDSRSWNGGRRR